MKEMLNSAKRVLEAQFRNLRKLFEISKGNRRIKILTAVLVVITLIFVIRLFFYVFLDDNAYAEVRQEGISFETMDPWDKLGNGVISQKCKIANYDFCSSLKVSEDAKIARNPKELERKIMALVAGYPIEKMVPFIARQDEKTAFFIVAIAKKESDWGKHVPTLNGQDCYNYWGYRGGYKQTKSGYSCFDSPEQAIEEVGGRISGLLEKKIDTPSEMVVWKCGSSCRTHDPGSVVKWIYDVDLYIKKLNS